MEKGQKLVPLSQGGTGAGAQTWSRGRAAEGCLEDAAERLEAETGRMQGGVGQGRGGGSAAPQGVNAGSAAVKIKATDGLGSTLSAADAGEGRGHTKAAEDVRAWRLGDVMMKRLNEAFEIMDEDMDGFVDMEDRKRERGLLTGFLTDLGLGPKTLDRVQKDLTLEQLQMEIEKEREIVLKMQSLAAVELQRLVAECVPRGSAENPLQGLQEMNDEQLDHHLRMDVVPRVKRALANVKAGLPKVTTVKSETVTEHMPADHASVEKAVFGDLNDFEKGIVHRIGQPASRLMEGMEAEHLRKDDSHKGFTGTKLKKETTSAKEWAIVTDQSKGDAASVPPRRVLSVDCVMEDKIAVEAGLRQEEVIALMLYTGPMFYKYNAVLRGFPESVVESLGGNKYKTTIYCIVSGIKKLSKVMKLPEDRKVYRGVQGIKLPDMFVSADACGVRGGVEFAMLSSSMKHSVALRYAGKVIPTLFELTVSGANRGASVSFLSQYPEDDEILFPPLSYLEVVCGLSRIEATPEGIVVHVVGVKVKSNRSSSTIEDIEGRRRQLFLSSAKNSVMDIGSKLRDERVSTRVELVLARRAYDKQNKMHEAVADSIEKEADEWLKGYNDKNGEWFDQQRQYASALRELTALESMAIGKFESWIDGTSGLTAEQLAKESMVQVSRRVRAEKKRQLDEISKVKGEGKKARQLALELCRESGIVIHGVDDRNGMLLEPGVVSCGVKGDVASLKMLSLAKCHVNRAAKKDGSTALHAASVMGHLEYVRELDEEGADVFARNASGETCLHLACQMGHSEVVRFLVEEYGKELCMAETTSGATCALLACRNGRMEALRCIRKAGGRDLLMKVAKNGASCAASAAGQGRLEVLEYLVEECGPEILELVTDQGMSCAYLASQNGHLECVRFLAEKGGKELLMKVTNSGVSCAHRACEQGHANVLKFLAEKCGKDLVMLLTQQGMSCAHLASRNGHLECLQELATVGESGLLMMVDGFGATCAHAAAERGHLNTLLVDVLSQANATDLLNKADDAGASCMHVAAQAGHSQALKEMLKTSVGKEYHHELRRALMRLDDNGLTWNQVAKPRIESDRFALVDLAGFFSVDGIEALEAYGSLYRNPSANDENHKRALEKLIKASKSDMDELRIGRHNKSCTQFAAERGHLESLKFLIDHRKVKPQSIKRTHLDHQAVEVRQVFDTLVLNGWNDVAESLQKNIGYDSETAANHEVGVVVQSTFPGNVMAVFREEIPPKSNSSSICLAPTLDFGLRSTLMSRSRCPLKRKAFYEIEIVKIGNDFAQLGFASDEFVNKEYLGSDSASWSVDGRWGRQMHGGTISGYGLRWREGDTVGLACDLDAGRMYVSVNGIFSPRRGFEVKLDRCKSGLFAALSLGYSKVRYNFGEEDFKYGPPFEGFTALKDAAHTEATVLPPTTRNTSSGFERSDRASRTLRHSHGTDKPVQCHGCGTSVLHGSSGSWDGTEMGCRVGGHVLGNQRGCCLCVMRGRQRCCPFCAESLLKLSRYFGAVEEIGGDWRELVDPDTRREEAILKKILQARELFTELECRFGASTGLLCENLVKGLGFAQSSIPITADSVVAILQTFAFTHVTGMKWLSSKNEGEKFLSLTNKESRFCCWKPYHVRVTGLNSRSTLDVTLLKNSPIVEIDISNNAELEILPIQSLCEMDSLVRLECKGCLGLTNVPSEIVNQGGAAVMLFLREAQKEGVSNHTMLLFTVGDGEAGKTSIVRALASDSNKAEHIDIDDRTVGIDMHSWRANPKTDLSFNVLDLAGQSLYATTHTFFLASRALYLMVWKAQNPANGFKFVENAAERMRGWLDTIQSRIPGARVLLVVTHVDLVSDTNELDRQCKIIQKAVQDLIQYQIEVAKVSGASVTPLRVFNNGQSVRVSCKSGVGIPELRESLIEYAEGCPWFGSVVPSSWITFRDKIVSERKNQKVKLRWDPGNNDEWGKLADASGVKQNMLPVVTRFFHDTGQISYFGSMAEGKDTKDAVLLRKTVYISPAWIVDMFKGVVRHDFAAQLRYIESEVSLAPLRRKLLHRMRRFAAHGYLHESLLPFLWRFSANQEQSSEVTHRSNLEQTPRSLDHAIEEALVQAREFWAYVFPVTIGDTAQNVSGNSNGENSVFLKEAKLWNQAVVESTEDIESGLCLLEAFSVLAKMRNNEYVVPAAIPSTVRTVDARAVQMTANFTCKFEFPDLPPGAFQGMCVRLRKKFRNAEITSAFASYHDYGQIATIFKTGILRRGWNITRITLNASTKLHLDVMIEEIERMRTAFPGLVLLERVEECRDDVKEPLHVVLLSSHYSNDKAVSQVADALIARKIGSSGDSNQKRISIVQWGPNEYDAKVEIRVALVCLGKIIDIAFLSKQMDELHKKDVRLIPVLLSDFPKPENYSHWWPNGLTILKDHSIFSDFMQVTPPKDVQSEHEKQRWIEEHRIQKEDRQSKLLWERIVRYLDAWRGSVANIGDWLRETIFCPECTAEGFELPGKFMREELIKKIEIHQNEQLKGLVDKQINGAEFLFNLEVTCGGDGRHKLQVESLLSMFSICESIPCPNCIGTGQPNAHCFNRKRLLDKLEEKIRAGVSEPCDRCNSLIRVADILRPEIFLSYSWGSEVRPQKGTQETTFVTQRLVFGIPEMIEQKTGAICWLDVHQRIEIGDNHVEKMSEGIDMASIVIIFVTDKYFNSPNCKREIYWALRNRKVIFPVLLPPPEGYPEEGWTGTMGAKWWRDIGRICRDASHPDHLVEKIDFSPLERTEKSVVIVESNDLDEIGVLRGDSAAANKLVNNILGRSHRGGAPIVERNVHVTWKTLKEAISCKLGENSSHKEALDKLFTTWDADKSEGLNKDEFANALKDLGFKLTEMQVQELFKTADKDSNEVISRKEFLAILSETDSG